MATNNSDNFANPIGVANGGSGLPTLTAHSIQIGNGTSSRTQLSVGLDHSSLLGNTGLDPGFTTSGTPYVSGISFNNGTNSMTTYILGTWTPAIAFGGASVGVTYTNQLGDYIKIGQMVWFSCRVTLSAVGSSSGNVTLTGLPFSLSSAIANTWQVVPRAAITFPTNVQYVSTLSIGAGTTASLNGVILNGTADVNLTNTNFANTSDFTVTGIYKALT